MTRAESCWLPRPNTKPWPPTGVTTIAGVRLAGELEQPPLVGVCGEASACSNDVDPEQRLLQPEHVQHRPRRRSRPDEPGAVAEDLLDDVVGDTRLRGSLGRERSRLGALDQAALDRHGQVAVQTRRDRARAEGRLVDVHHLGLAKLANAPFDEAGGELTCAPRVHGEHGRVHLHACRDSEHGHPVADRFEDVDRRAVAAGEEQQVDAVLGQRRRGRAGVRGGRDRADRADDPGLEPGLPRLGSPISPA